jgi:hypothetical protein
MRNYKQTNKNPRPFWISAMWKNEQPNQGRTHFGVWRNSVASFLGGWIRVWGSEVWETLELFWNLFSLSLFFILESKDIIRTFEDLRSFSLSSKIDELFLQINLHANQPYHELLLILLLPLQVLCIAWNGTMWWAFFLFPKSDDASWWMSRIWIFLGNMCGFAEWRLLNPQATNGEWLLH